MTPAELAQHALTDLRRDPGVDYADARVVQLERELIKLRDHDLDRLDAEDSEGVGVRVLYRGAWGFAARPGLTAESAAAAARDALDVARAAAQVTRTRIRLAEEEPARGRWQNPVAEDPFAVPLDRKLADLRAMVAAARDGLSAEDARRLRAVDARMIWLREHKWFASTEGAATEQHKTVGGAGLKITAEDAGEVAVRCWPNDLDGGVYASGYENVARLGLSARAPGMRDEALALLTAPALPAGRTNLILDTPQLALQIHESCGHPTEADRAIGEEVSLAGASFLTPDKLGRFTYGSSRVNLTADSLAPRGLGTFGWDDEGVAARRTPLVARGTFVGYLSSRETAEKMGLGRSAGCMRAMSWARPAVIRMINVSLEPDSRGPRSLDELVADTADGVLMSTNRSWSIDDLRLNFQFGCEAAWEVKRGKRTRLFKKPLYTGITPRFWNGCDAIGAPEAAEMWGFLSCGKGDPIQLMAVGHGCSPARFAGVEVGSAS